MPTDAQFESGLHRYVRMVPLNDSEHFQWHTISASVRVYPYFGDAEDGNRKDMRKLVDIDPADLKVETIRSPGVNAQDCQVRIISPFGFLLGCEYSVHPVYSTIHINSY